ncbi:MAG: AMP-binding protein [Acidobacteriota bacterium]
MKLRTLVDLVFHIRAISGGRSELLSSDSGSRREVFSAADFLRGIHSLTLALEERGLAKGERVAIFSENRPEWHTVDFACQLLGAPTVAIAPGTTRQQVGFMLRNCASRWVFYRSFEQREILLSLISTLTTPPELVAFEGEAAVEGGVSITRLMGEGASRLGDVPIERYRGRIEEEDPACLVYSIPGPSEDPQRDQLTQRDMVRHIQQLEPVIPLSHRDLALSSSPLANLLPRSFDHLCFYRGAAIHYSDGELLKTLQSEQPSHLVAASNRYLEIHRAIQEAAARDSRWRRILFRWGIEAGRRYAAASRTDFIGPWLALKRRLASALVFRRIDQQLGGNLRCLISDDQDLPTAVVDFYEALGKPLLSGLEADESQLAS